MTSICDVCCGGNNEWLQPILNMLLVYDVCSGGDEFGIYWLCLQLMMADVVEINVDYIHYDTIARWAQ